MSIATELTALQTNLSNAKNAVTTKGGTVGDTGLAGLAAEIATIPSGGSLSNYGSVTYLDDNNVEQTVTMASEKDYVELTVGTNITPIKINNVSIKKDNITGVVIADGVQYIPNEFCMGCTHLTSATIPSSVHYIGGSVFYGCNISSPTFSLDNVLEIGGAFLYGNTNFNSPIALPKVEVIGNSFMSGDTSFNSALTINDNCETIGAQFLEGCTSFAQSFSLPSGLYMLNGITNPGGRFMSGCDNFTGSLICNCPPTNLPSNGAAYNYVLATTNASAPMYTTGVTLTGTYARAWKGKLADRTSSPYRKLIVGS